MQGALQTVRVRAKSTILQPQGQSQGAAAPANTKENLSLIPGENVSWGNHFLT